jgi:hypothetical protein
MEKNLVIFKEENKSSWFNNQLDLINFIVDNLPPNCKPFLLEVFTREGILSALKQSCIELIRGRIYTHNLILVIGESIEFFESGYKLDIQ